MSDTPIRIFISYSHHNRDICDIIAAALEKTGELSVWYDKGLIPGEEYRKRIAEVIRGVDYFIVLLSRDSVQSEWVLDEVEYAKKLHKRILPIWIQETELPDDLDMILQRYHSLFWHLRSSDSQFEEILYSTILRREPENQGKSLVGNGNDFSESENQLMKSLLQKESKGVYAECYTPENACTLGKAYLFGGPCTVDREKARFYFQIAQYRGNPDGAFYLLQMQLEDQELDTWDEPDAEYCAPIVAQIRELADSGSIAAKLFMGNLYWYGKYGCPVDIPKSTAMYEDCARLGNARAQYMMSANYYFGDGVPQNYILAIMYANLAIEQRYIKGWRRWGKFYRDGLAVKQDYIKARECYEKGARMGDFNCFNKVGDMLYYGWGFPVDYTQAFSYYLKGEQAPVCGQSYSYRKAKEALGRCYELGHGVPQDLAIAAEKYLEGYRFGSEACKQGYLRCRAASGAAEPLISPK